MACGACERGQQTISSLERSLKTAFLPDCYASDCSFFLKPSPQVLIVLCSLSASTSNRETRNAARDTIWHVWPFLREDCLPWCVCLLRTTVPHSSACSPQLCLFPTALPVPHSSACSPQLCLPLQPVSLSTLHACSVFC